MRDVESYYAAWPLTEDAAAERDSLRAQYQRHGWAEAGQGMMQDILIAELLSRGRASVRTSDGRYARFIRIAVDHTGESVVVSHTNFYLPDGQLFLRVFAGTDVS